MKKEKRREKKRRKEAVKGEAAKPSAAFLSVCERNGLQKPKLQDVQLQASSRVDERRDCGQRQRKTCPKPAKASRSLFPPVDFFQFELEA